jgi:hypothetical protein
MTFGNTSSSDGQTKTISSDDALMSFDYFKHEVDLQDMEDTKAIAKAQ